MEKDQLNLPIRKAVENAQALLAHAMSCGMELPAELIGAIVDGKALLSSDLMDSETFKQQAEFWKAHGELAKAVQPVTIASLKASAQTGLKRSWCIARSDQVMHPYSPAEQSVRKYQRLALLALFMLLIVQVYWVVGSQVIRETKGILINVQSNEAAWAELKSADDPQAQALEAQQMALGQEVSIRYDILESWNRVWMLPLWIFYSKVAEPEQSRKYGDLQRAQLVGEFAAQSIERYLLPLLYGWLGACVYVLRKLAQEIKNLSYTPEQDMVYRLRIYMGALAGLIAVWFLPAVQYDTNIQSLSVFAVALLVGYSIDLLFAFMDRIISAFTTER